MTAQDDSSSDNNAAGHSPTLDKDPGAHVEQVHTNERVPGHPGYYEKDGLRTYGDDENHDVEPPVSYAARHACPYLPLLTVVILR
jgi:hypothetical protein